MSAHNVTMCSDQIYTLTISLVILTSNLITSPFLLSFFHWSNGMTPLSEIHSSSTLSGFIYRTRCHTHSLSSETGSHHPTPTSYSLHESIPKMTHTETSPSKSEHTMGASTRQGTPASTHTSVPGKSIVPTSVRQSMTLATNVFSTAASTTLSTRPSSLPTNSLQGDSSLPTTPPAPTPESPDLMDHASTKIALAFLGLLLLIVVCLWFAFFGLPWCREYLAKRKLRKDAQADQCQWWDWIKTDRENPWVPALIQHSETREMHHLSKMSSAVLEEQNTGSSSQSSGPRTVGSWPLRSAAAQGTPQNVSMPVATLRPSVGSFNSRSTTVNSRDDRMYYFSTYKSDIEQIHRRSEQSDQSGDPYNSPTVFIGLRDARAVCMHSASPDMVDVRKSEVARFSYASSDRDDKRFVEPQRRLCTI